MIILYCKCLVIRISATPSVINKFDTRIKISNAVQTIRFLLEASAFGTLGLYIELKLFIAVFFFRVWNKYNPTFKKKNEILSPYKNFDVVVLSNYEAFV